MNETIISELRGIIKHYLPVDVSIDDVTENKHLITDLKINSAYIVDIIIDIEEKFDISIEDDTIGEMNTVRDAIEMISQKVN